MYKQKLETMYVLSNYNKPFAVITEQGDTKQKIKQAINEEFLYDVTKLDPSFTLPDWGEEKVLEFVLKSQDDDEKIEDNISVIKLATY